MIDPADSIAPGDQASANVHPSNYGRGSATALIWTDSVITSLVCNLAFVVIMAFKSHHVACLTCGWLGWFMIGISMRDGEYSSLLSAWTYLVMLGAPVGETLQFEREAVICCTVVLLPWIPLFVGTSVIETTEGKLYVVVDVLQLFRVGGPLYTSCYMALLGLLFSINRFVYFSALENYLLATLAWECFSILPLIPKIADLNDWNNRIFPSLRTVLFSITLASFGTILSLVMRWASTDGPFSDLVDLESPVYQIMTALIFLGIELGVIVSCSQARRRIYPEQYLHSYQWGLERLQAAVSKWICSSGSLIKRRIHGTHHLEKYSDKAQLKSSRRCQEVYGSTCESGETIEKSPGEKNASFVKAQRARLNLLITTLNSLISSLLAILVVAGISMINNDSEAWWQLAGYVGWVGLLYSIIELRLSSSIMAWVILIAFGSNCEGKSTPQRTMTILIGSPCFLFIVRHFNAKVRHPPCEAPGNLPDVEKVHESMGTLGVMCIVAIHWFVAVVWIAPLLSTIIIQGPKLRIDILEDIKPWQLDICIFVGAIFAGLCLAIVCATKDGEHPKEVPTAPCSLFGATVMQIFTRLILAPTSYNFIESRVEASFYQVHSVIWTFLVVLMFICICGFYNEHSLPDIVWLFSVKNTEAVPLCSIRATFGLARRLKFVPTHLGTDLVLDDFDQ